MDRQQLGRQGETLACRALRRLGYAILDRRYRTRFGELDIVARDRATLVFVEVKARAVESHGTALDDRGHGARLHDPTACVGGAVPVRRHRRDDRARETPSHRACHQCLRCRSVTGKRALLVLMASRRLC
ncbi:MAG: hypothetical protein CL476_06460 [Acidobacteria bacterium]|nr:hypothetical protein [Acidobacteriota bacterium]